MRTAIILIIMITASESFADNYFINVRNGYIIRDTNTFNLDSGESFDADYGHEWRINISAGYKPEWCKKFSCKLGVSHESSVLSGSPFNDEYEYTNEQVFFEVEVEF